MLAFFDENPIIPLRIFITSRVEQHIKSRLWTHRKRDCRPELSSRCASPRRRSASVKGRRRRT
jgi:hypothetical protein